MSVAHAFNDALADLKDTLDSQETILKVKSLTWTVRRDCSALILRSLSSFLLVWDKSRHTTTDDSANELVRRGMTTLLAEIGPGDIPILDGVLDVLPKLSSSKSRQPLLDALPWFLPSDEKGRDAATDQVLAVFGEILGEDGSALIPIIGCLSCLPMSQRGRTEAWELALSSMPSVEEEDLPVLVKSVLSNASDEAEATKAIQAIRSESRLLEITATSSKEGDDEILPMVLHVVLSSLHGSDNGPMLSQCYQTTLMNVVDEEDDQFLLVDLVVALSLLQKNGFGSKVGDVLDALLRNQRFPFETMRFLLSTTKIRGRQQSSLKHEDLSSAFVVLAVFMLTSPLRLRQLAGSILNRSQEFVVDLHHFASRDVQHELVLSLLQLADETAILSHHCSLNEGSRDRYQGLDETCAAVHDTLTSLASAAPASMIRFKGTFMERLFSDKHGTVESYEKVCSILVALEGPNQASGGESAELMIILQKLLLSSQRVHAMKQGNMEKSHNDRSVRGVLLATEMLKSQAYSHPVRESIEKWVVGNLLPLDRRTIRPHIGAVGLRFLEVMSSSGNGKQKSFQHLKMILANTGLVQMTEQYKQRRRKGRPTRLIFTEPLSHKTGKRSLLLCVDSYIQIRGLQSVHSWRDDAIWVYDLIDSYLRAGRGDRASPGANAKTTKRSKWLPDGWLESSIELPALNDFAVEKESLQSFDSIKAALYHDTAGHNLWSSEVVGTAGRIQVKKGLDITDLSRSVDGVMRLGLALVLSVNISQSILNNSVEHALLLSPNGDADRLDELRGLISHKLTKLYDLARRTRLAAQLSRRLGSAIKSFIRRCRVEDTGSSGLKTVR